MKKTLPDGPVKKTLPDGSVKKTLPDLAKARASGQTQAENLRAEGRRLSPLLEELFLEFHRPEYLASDPLAVVHEFTTRDDRELGALFSALLAYGNVKQIQGSLRRLFDAMSWSPAAFVRGASCAEASARLRGFRHRFTDGEDVACLCWLLRQLLSHGPAENAFLVGYNPDEPDLACAAGRFADMLHAMDFPPGAGRARMLAKSSFKHLLPHTSRGSACKRIHLFLRWMVRPNDGIDLGLWSRIPKEKLLVPVDTHVLRLGRMLGLHIHTTASLSAARDITEALRGADPLDPVRFDFALTRAGIMGLTGRLAARGGKSASVSRP